MLWINGQERETISVLDRGFAYGDGLFETMRLVNGQLPLWSMHRTRLLDGLERLGIPVDSQQLGAEVARASHRYGSGILKLTVTRGQGGHAYRPPAEDETRATRILQGRPLKIDPDAREGIDVIVCKTRLSRHPELAGLKHLNRLEQVLASRELQEADVREGLMCDVDGNIMEGTFTNLFVVRDGVLSTPPVQGGVAGVMRRFILETAADKAISFNEDLLTAEDMLAADEVFVCNSVIGIWPVRHFNGKQVKSGTMTRSLQQVIDDLFTE